MKRTFIAIKIPFKKQTLEEIQQIKTELKDEKIKWVESWNLHLTIKFLGETEENKIEETIVKLNENLQSIRKFDIKIHTLGIFGPLNNPKVIWIGIDRSDYLQDIKNIIDNALNDLGFNFDNNIFKPHLTIGRIKYIKDKARLKEIIERYKDYEFDFIKVDKVFFYESQLTQKGPIYRVIKENQLV